MTSRHRILRRLSLPALCISCYLFLQRSTSAEHIPVRYRVNGKQTECVYEQLRKNDVVTFSVFVLEALNNGKPRASITFEGPVAGNKDLIVPWNAKEDNANDGEGEHELPMPAGARGKMTVGRDIRRSLLNDWPTIKGPHAPEGVIERKFKIDWTHAGESEDAEAARAALREKNHEEFRTHSLEHKGSDDAPPPPLHTMVQHQIAPYEETMDISADGWYRLCVASEFFPIVVEMDMRSADRLQGIDAATGHVYTHARRDYLDEQQALFGADGQPPQPVHAYDTKDGHKQAVDEDFEESKIKLKYMHELTSEIMKSQHQRMHRTRAHDADARRGAADLAWSGKFETLLYVIITGVQVYSVHKWLLGNLLGQ